MYTLNALTSYFEKKVPWCQRSFERCINLIQCKLWHLVIVVFVDINDISGYQIECHFLSCLKNIRVIFQLCPGFILHIGTKAPDKCYNECGREGVQINMHFTK